MSKIDLKIIELSKQKFEDLKQSKLVLEFKGKTVHSSITNSLRRCSLNEIPTYAFCSDSIIIEENTSIYDNDYMRLRIEQMTIPNIKIPVIILDDKYWKNVDYSDLNREKDPKDNLNIEMVINYRNDTNDIVNLTTNDIELYKDGENIKNRFDNKYPHLIIKLRPGEVFKCTAKAVLGKGLSNNIWAAAATSYHEYEYETPNNIILTIESQGQLDEYEIIKRSCMIIIDKIKKNKDRIENGLNDEIKNGNFVELKLDNESHTIGEVINDFLQINDDIAFSGLSRPDLLKEEIVIKMKSVKNNPLKPLFETMDYVIKIYENILEQINKLAK